MDRCLCKTCMRVTCGNAGISTSIVECGVYCPPKPMTNADRIRAMSDEELAWELARICRMPFYKDDSEIDGYEVNCWAKWLKQKGKKND